MSLVRPVALQVVVEMRQVDERQRRRVLGQHVERGVDDPAGRCDAGAGPQNRNSGKGPSFRVRSSRNSGGTNSNPAACGRLPCRSGAAVPMSWLAAMLYHQNRLAQVKAASPLAGFPDLLAGHQAVRLTPEQHLHQVAEEPAVRDDAVVPRGRSPVRTWPVRARDRRRHGLKGAHRTGGRPRQMRRAPAEVARA